MKFRIEFDTDNAAFKDNLSLEVRDVLDQAARKATAIETGDSNYRGLFDSNGNRVGRIEVVED